MSHLPPSAAAGAAPSDSLAGLCPVCGQPNGCACAAPGGGPCWCLTMPAPPGGWPALHALREAGQSAAGRCLCRDCLRRGAAD